MDIVYEENRMNNDEKFYGRYQCLKKVFPYIQDSKLLMFAIVFFQLLTIAITILLPVMYGYYIEEMIEKSNLSKGIYVIIGYIVLYFGETVAVVGFKYTENKLAVKMVLKIKKKLLYTYARMEYSDFMKLNAGDLRIRIEEDSKILSEFFIKHIVNYNISFINIIVVLVIIFFINPILTIFGIVMIAISFYFTKIIGEKVRRTSERYRENQGEFEDTIKEALYKWKEIKTDNLINNVEDILVKKWDKITKLIMKKAFFQYLHSALVAVNLVFVTRMNLYFLGGLLVTRNLLTVASMLVFMNYYEQVFSKVQIVSDSIMEWKAQSVNIEKIFSALDYRPAKEYFDIRNFDKCIELSLKNLSFRYERSNNYVLRNINVDIRLDGTIALVGKSGCGKTTLVNLLLGIYTPTEGSLYYGDIDLEKVVPSSRNKIVTAVTQTPELLNLSILENLKLVRPNATMEEIEDACRRADIYDFIQSTPNKYETIIGERGIKISGGQKQRLAIARVLLSKASIVIFDEATSALDNESEGKVVKAIAELAESKTIISIAHRFSTIARYDRLYMLQNGSFVFEGKIEELLKNSSLTESIFKL